MYSLDEVYIDKNDNNIWNKVLYCYVCNNCGFKWEVIIVEVVIYSVMCSIKIVF